MTCAEVQSMAESYTAGELPVDTNHEIIAHLDRCEDCRAEFAARESFRRTLQRAFRGSTDLAPDPRFVARVHARIANDRVGASRRFGAPGHWMAIAASLVAVTITGWLLLTGGTSGPSAALAALTAHAAGDHRYCALEHALEKPPIPLEEAARRYGAVYGTLRDVVAGSPPVQAGEVEVIGAHWCEFDGKQFAHVVVRRRDHIVSILLTPTDTTAGPDIAQVDACQSVDGLQVACFETRGHAAFVVSDMTQSETVALAQELAPVLHKYFARA